MYKNPSENKFRKAYLVRVSLVTRIVANPNISEEEMLDIARPQLIQKLRTELSENLDSIELDIECPEID